MKITKLRVNETKDEIKLSKCNVLIGANNVGKSQVLMDIKDIFVPGNANNSKIVVKDLDLDTSESFEELTKGVTMKNLPNGNE